MLVALPTILVSIKEVVEKCLESEARVRAALARLRSVLSLSPPAASGPCLGARALVGVRGRPLLFPLFPPLFPPVLVRCARWGQTAKAKATVGMVAQAIAVCLTSC